jgi:hypothetical protein
MWLVSMLVVVPVFYLATGQPITPEIANWLGNFVPNDSTISDQSVALGCISGIALAGSPLHLVGRYLPTVVHELGHAFTAGVLGGRPQQITISLNTSGLAYFHPPESWGRVRATLVSIAGYLAPPIAALAAVMAAQAGFPQSWFLFSTGVLAIAIVFLVRNIWGFVWTAAIVAGCYFSVRYLPANLIANSVPVIAGYLSVEGFRDARNQQKIIKWSPGSGCDAECIARYWRLKPVLVGRIHTLLVAVIGGIALKLAIEPYWAEIYEWGEEIVSNRTIDRLLP